MPRSPFDREIVRLAVPAFATLLAEPLYILVDTAVVGHLGTAQLAGLAVASSILLTGVNLCVFLAYGTTAAVARLLGAGDHEEAAHQGMQGLWLGGLIGVTLAVLAATLAGQVVSAFGARGATAEHAETYLRISALGVPFLLLTMAGTGYLRGLKDTVTPLVLAVAGAVGNLVLELLFVYGLDRGIAGSAESTVIVQVVVGVVFVLRVIGPARRFGAALAPDWRRVRALARVGADLFVRTAALRLALLVMTVVATRLGPVDVGASEVALAIWSFLAMGHDSLAIAAQALVGHQLGAGRAADARAASRRLVEIGLTVGALLLVLVIGLHDVLPHAFSDDRAVTDLAAFLLIWVGALQPLAAWVFVLDGVLIGAGDQRFLAIAMTISSAAFLVAAAPVLPLDLGIGWLWLAFAILMTARGITLGWRYRGSGWLVEGAVR